MLDLKSLIPFHHNDKSREIAKASDTPPDPVRDPFWAMRREMDRMFDRFLSGSALTTPDSSWSAGLGQLASLEVTDGEKELSISAELPGLGEEDVDVKISGDLLTIEGEKSVEDEKTEGERTYSERRYGKFSRTIRLPFAVTNEKIDATFNKGVLHIKLEKPTGQQQAVKHININAT
jgi:HSP20 family protein